jgi:hypothetical protein
MFWRTCKFEQRLFVAVERGQVGLVAVVEVLDLLNMPAVLGGRLIPLPAV